MNPRCRVEAGGGSGVGCEASGVEKGGSQPGRGEKSASPLDVDQVTTHIPNQLSPHQAHAPDRPTYPDCPDSRDLRRQRPECHHHSINRVLQIQNFPSGVDLYLLQEVAERDGFGDFGDGADFRGEIGSELVHDPCEFSPGSFDV
jgi:hypothetical protein